MGFPHIHMRSKTQNPLNMKLLLLGIFLAFLLLFVLRSNLSSAPESPSPTNQDPPSEEIQSGLTTTCSQCSKLPASVSQALVHYATSNITPQQTASEISVSSRVLERKSPCNFLVFGLGHDSPMWAALNYGGRTVFLEEDKAWIEQVTTKFPGLETYHVVYDTKVRHADDLMKVGQQDDCTVVGDARFSKCGLALKGVPSDVYEVEWDLIMVDAPTGYFSDAPGRMGAIYTAGMMARYRKDGETDVFVHDVDRTVEDKFSKAFLCKGYMSQQEGRLRHFTIPSHRDSSDKPFCPKR
ncbi:glucuronoxylan 4-O-methyltransferase 1-like [Magnolia sinica]|uniref:glucuronoxylan 4-O-methyltransferase 1-like n=1 Tax=Magnolia sinica TaxID=86752 RepID=UPI0026588A57|nr:glucuronoxylan 4-O-methyltransferase 1-like [Magnolia sinica]